MLDRRNFLRLMGAAAAAPALHAAPARKPNFLVILADDMGFSDARCYGGEIDTPNLDRLAAGGIRFTQMYSTARCGPSRSSLLTGYYAQQTACDVMTPGNIPNYTRFIPDHLKPLGYRTYHSGKWHIKFTPREGVGFDHSYTLMDENRYFTPQLSGSTASGCRRPKPEDHYYTTTSSRTTRSASPKSTRASTLAIPFFLYLAPHSPHFPLQAPAEDIASYKDRSPTAGISERERKLARMRRMGLVNCALPPLEPNMWTQLEHPGRQLLAKIGPGEVTQRRAVADLTPEQKSFQRTKMAIHAAMITRMDPEIGRSWPRSRPWARTATR